MMVTARNAAELKVVCVVPHSGGCVDKFLSLIYTHEPTRARIYQALERTTETIEISCTENFEGSSL